MYISYIRYLNVCGIVQPHQHHQQFELIARVYSLRFISRSLRKALHSYNFHLSARIVGERTRRIHKKSRHSAPVYRIIAYIFTIFTKTHFFFG